MIYVIAEPGSTHGRDVRVVADMIMDARKAGCSAFKMQWVSKAERLVERRAADSYLAAYKLIEFPVEAHRDFAAECQRHGIDYLCTTYLPEDVVAVAPYVAGFKIASFEALDFGFLAQHVGRGKPVYVSTGMMTEADLLFYLARRDRWEELWLLHCVSSYPAPLAQLNLRVITKYGLDGYSDHSSCLWGGALAVAAGARIVEVHMRPDCCDPTNLDYEHSLRPSELARYVQNIRAAEAMLGDGTKRPMDCERPMEAYRANRAPASHARRQRVSVGVAERSRDGAA